MGYIKMCTLITGGPVFPIFVFVHKKVATVQHEKRSLDIKRNKEFHPHQVNQISSNLFGPPVLETFKKPCYWLADFRKISTRRLTTTHHVIVLALMSVNKRARLFTEPQLFGTPVTTFIRFITAIFCQPLSFFSSILN